MRLRTIFLIGVLVTFLGSAAFPIMVTDKLRRGKFYQIRFRLKGERGLSRYIGLYTQKTLNADMFIYDSTNKLLARVSGTSGKYPKAFAFPKKGIYTAKVVASSGSGPFLMVISNQEELKKIINNVK